MCKLDLLCFDVKGAFEGDKADRALSWLPTAEHPSVMRFKFDKDRHLALASLLLRRHYFSQELQVPWFDLEFDRLPAGKPILKQSDLLHYDFNISHEGDWVIFGCTKNMKIGVDAVAIDRPKNQSIDAYLKSFQPQQLTPNEMQLILNSGDNAIRLETFYQLWGCKESYTKAIGLGLSLDFQKLEFSNENDTQIKMKLDGKRLDNWAFHMCRLDSVTLAIVCFGFIEISSKLDQPLIEFSQSTQLLGLKRHEFWETAPSYGGKEEIWQALQVAFSEEDIMMARSILEAANIILPTGNPCDGCFDELGNEYEIPVYCVVPPENLILEQQSDTMTEDDRSSLALSCTFLMKETPSIYSNFTTDQHQQLVPAPDCSMNPFTVVVRLSTEKDISLTISSQNETVGSFRRRLFDYKELKIANETHILRLVYLGRVLQDKMFFVCSNHEVDIEKTFAKKGSVLIEKDSIIQALIAIKS
ncbi:hypothetical protein [Parasitella parasitica]|uniref:holo-[acyl-carrier-protein] synthase n=1 Tax=Parasitella parasitica TaxID=35722 RepID=A0A0B7N9L6_9FUNG|nr:hypothetical protein [Parasitella parasitica]